MPYEDLLSGGVIRPHRLNDEEMRVRIEEMLALAERDLGYGEAGGLPSDLHYICAYEAARTAGQTIMLAEGFRPGKAEGNHLAVFHFLQRVDRGRWRDEARLFDQAREKRNTLQYVRPGVATEADVRELAARAHAFLSDVLDWLHLPHPDLLPPPPSEPA